jgi:dTDP-4-dehydrorhamnose 3,5-epimerase
MQFEFKQADIAGVILIKTKRSEDNRGTFIKGFEKETFSPFLLEPFVEDYVSESRKNVLRGLHYQIEPRAQGKLITVLIGRILDIAIDLRKASKTLYKYSMNELSIRGWDSVWIPKGFAHGFLSLEDDSTVLNRCTGEFDQSLERGIRWNDPFFKIDWPVNNPILSEKDQLWKLWNQ